MKILRNVDKTYKASTFCYVQCFSHIYLQLRDTQKDKASWFYYLADDLHILQVYTLPIFFSSLFSYSTHYSALRMVPAQYFSLNVCMYTMLYFCIITDLFLCN